MQKQLKKKKREEGQKRGEKGGGGSDISGFEPTIFSSNYDHLSTET